MHTQKERRMRNPLPSPSDGDLTQLEKEAAIAELQARKAEAWARVHEAQKRGLEAQKGIADVRKDLK